MTECISESNTLLRAAHLDQESDGSRGLTGNVVPEGELADGAGLFPDGAPNMSFITFQPHWCSLQVDKVT